MSNTIYATFSNPADAEKAAGALLDHGVRPEDLSVVRHEGGSYTPVAATNANRASVPLSADPTITALQATTPPPAGDSTYVREQIANGDLVETPEDVDDVAKYGITTTTAGDASAGAIKGTMVGAGIGAIAALAALIVPGVGIVIGLGTLATAIGGVLATAGAGAAAGALVGYLKDMGVDDEVASEYGEAIENGGAILAVTVPSGTVDEDEATAVLNKYAATNINHYAARGYVA